MDRPVLPPIPAGRSALPAFLEVEAWAAERLQSARAQAAVRLDDARLEAERIRAQGEASLREAVRAGEQEAMRTAADHARDRLSAARRSVTQWIEQAESNSRVLVDEALLRLRTD